MNDQELALAAGSIVNPKPYSHKSKQSFAEMETSSYHCQKCGEVVIKDAGYTKEHCEFVTPIDIDDLGLALTWFKKLCPDISYRNLDSLCKPFMHKNWRAKTGRWDSQVILTLNWLLFKATSRQLWEIIIQAKEM